VEAAVTVAGEGPLPATGMVIGEAPGARESELGRPFVGPSGALLDQALSMLRISRAELYITNVVKEWPRDERGKTRRPTAAELRFWRPCLQQELDRAQPEAILLLGKTAAESWGYHPQLVQKNIFAAWHPAFLLRSGGDQGMWEQWLFQIHPFVRAFRSAERLRASS
jgi:DNA polymerase